MSSVTIESGEEPGTQKVVVVSDGSEKITAVAAIASLGEKISRYVVETWGVES